MFKNIIKSPQQEWVTARVAFLSERWVRLPLSKGGGSESGFLLHKRQAVNFDEAGIVTLGLVEGEGEVLHTVFGTELHEEVGVLSQLYTEPFYIIGRCRSG